MNKSLLISFILSAIFLSGCITIHEDYKFNKNGSGTMEYTIDMSKLLSMMQSFSESENSEDLQIDQSFIEATEELKSIKGISNVSLTGNNSEYIYGIKYDFTDIDVLNEAMSSILKQESHYSKYISIDGKKITRHSVISDEFSFDKLKGKEEGEIDKETMQGIFEQMKYFITMNFQRPVKSVTTMADYNIKGKTIFLETNFAKILENKKNLETQIILK